MSYHNNETADLILRTSLTSGVLNESMSQRVTGQYTTNWNKMKKPVHFTNVSVKTRLQTRNSKDLLNIPKRALPSVVLLFLSMKA